MLHYVDDYRNSLFQLVNFHVPKFSFKISSFNVLVLNVRLKNLRCIIIFVKIFIRFLRAKIFLQ